MNQQFIQRCYSLEFSVSLGKQVLTKHTTPIKQHHFIMKNIFIAIFLLLIGTTAAQELPQLIPPSPEAAALGKFIDVPVSYHTGIPQIGIPLCSITNTDINIPISLNYHGSGIRVDELASRVGLGWSLSGMGSITRSVRGIPDDAIDGYLNPHVSVQSFIDAYAGVTPGEPVLGNLQDYFNLALANEIDFESDIYYFNLPGGASGKFYFKQNGEIVMMPYNQDIQIIPIKDNSGFYITQWQVTLANGIKYYLGSSKNGQRIALDRTTTNSSTNGSIPDSSIKMTNYVSAWHILDIETPNQSTIQYNYEPLSTSVFSFGGASNYFWTQGDCNPPANTATYIETLTSTYRPISISSDQGSIEFEYNLSLIHI